MPKCGVISTQDFVVIRILKGMGEPSLVGTFPVLNRNNYQVWASRMHLHLDGLELWEIVKAENAPRKKDRQVMLIMFSTILDEITWELVVEKTAKQTWDFLKTKNGGMSHLRMARIQSLKRDFEFLSMDEDELVFGLFRQGEKIPNDEIVFKLLRSVLGKFGAITSLIDQFQDFDSLTLDEVIGSLKVHEDKAFGKFKKKEDDNSRGRGTGCGRSQGRSSHRNENGGEEDEKPRDKSKVTCYKCKKLRHYVNECYQSKKYQLKKDKSEKVNIVEKDEKRLHFS
ncbi:unnamed protein product [Spirodela intermedia]|uniref:DUF4219 domain-containing protein n=1 Tax=Spirodela intermedia TaxID=51605 RepID=A0A7I8KXZ8_SPIIN|nr:unnamed protein product [Spirodela intermedia]